MISAIVGGVEDCEDDQPVESATGGVTVLTTDGKDCSTRLRSNSLILHRAIICKNSISRLVKLRGSKSITAKVPKQLP